jgi:hypothetical protein
MLVITEVLDFIPLDNQESEMKNTLMQYLLLFLIILELSIRRILFPINQPTSSFHIGTQVLKFGILMAQQVLIIFAQSNPMIVLMESEAIATIIQSKITLLTSIS